MGGGELAEEPRDIVMQKNTTDTGPTNNDDKNRFCKNISVERREESW